MKLNQRDSCNQKEFPLYKLRDLLNFLLPDLDALTEKLYGFSLGGYRVAIMVAWILMIAGVFAFIWLKKRKNYKRIVCGILSLGVIFSLFSYIDRGSILITMAHPESATDSVFLYYSKNESKQQKADFQVESYDAAFKIDRKLTATTKMKIGKQTQQDSYQFTLYHNYKIRKVYAENGNKLTFVQDGDYFDVLKPYGKELDNIIVEYSGFSEAFYSNKQAVFLPGFFAYYPQPGYNTVFSLKDNAYIASDNDDSKFKVSINSKLKLVSNLEGNGTSFEGASQNLTLIGGYLEEKKINGFDTIMYPLDKDLQKEMESVLSEEYQGRIETAKVLLGEKDAVDFSNKKIINIPFSLAFNSLLEDVYMYDDSMIINAYNIVNNEYIIFNSCIPNTVQKQALKNCFLLRVSNAIDGKEMFLFSEKGIDSKSVQVSDILTTKIIELGVEHVAPIVYQYLKDEGNTQDELEFLKNIK